MSKCFRFPHGMASGTTNIILIFFIFVGLVVFIILYRKLNRETNGEYTFRHVLYKQGGLRDRLRRAAGVLETRLGVQLWPSGDTNEDGQEMRDFQEERRRSSRCSSGSEASEGEDGSPRGSEVKARRESATEEESLAPDVFVNLNQFSGSVMWSDADAKHPTLEPLRDTSL
ncbi:uncharacterized protein si:ch211-119e14.1 [Syngnathoides biaculeatus]|uniref:uncharacterized protein si:ch211-119e14.1 n=1 Tax=Syngnathoides biaculeatus TaxID=300417 RepID=UPI002ADD3BB1|nr:uncharacterized protein si:ch211-119e14.1 [Syngnathoides biaculeatus]